MEYEKILQLINTLNVEDKTRLIEDIKLTLIKETSVDPLTQAAVSIFGFNGLLNKTRKSKYVWFRAFVVYKTAEIYLIGDRQLEKIFHIDRCTIINLKKKMDLLLTYPQFYNDIYPLWKQYSNLLETTYLNKANV